MGMSTHIIAFIPDTDPLYKKHLKIWNVCEEEGVSLPKETSDYFKGADNPEEKLKFELEKGVHYKEWNADMEDGFEINISKLPKEVKTIRVYNSY